MSHSSTLRRSKSDIASARSAYQRNYRDRSAEIGRLWDEIGQVVADVESRTPMTDGRIRNPDAYRRANEARRRIAELETKLVNPVVRSSRFKRIARRNPK